MTAGDFADGGKPPRRRPTFSEGVAFSVLSFGSIAVLSLVTAVVTARVYGIQVMGEFALAFAPTGIVWVLSSVREQPALVRALAPLAPRDPRATGLFPSAVRGNPPMRAAARARCARSASTSLACG